MDDITLFAGLHGPAVLPGEYTARVRASGHSDEVTFELKPDPRRHATAQETAEWAARVNETAALLENVLNGLGELRHSQAQIESLMANHTEDAALQQSGKAAVEAITAWDHQIIQHLHETYEDEDAWETRMAGQLRYLLDVIEHSGAPVTAKIEANYPWLLISRGLGILLNAEGIIYCRMVLVAMQFEVINAYPRLQVFQCFDIGVY